MSGQMPSNASFPEDAAATTVAERAYRSSAASPSRRVGSPRSRAKSSDPKARPTTRSDAAAIRGASTSAAALSIDATMRIVPGAIVIARSRASSSCASQSTSSARRTFGATMPSRPARTTASRSASPASLNARRMRTKRSGPPCEGRASTSPTARLASSFDAGGTPSSRSRIATSSTVGPNSASPSARATIRSRCAGTNMSDRIGRGASINKTAASPGCADRCRRGRGCC